MLDHRRWFLPGGRWYPPDLFWQTRLLHRKEYVSGFQRSYDEGTGQVVNRATNLQPQQVTEFVLMMLMMRMGKMMMIILSVYPMPFFGRLLYQRPGNVFIYFHWNYVNIGMNIKTCAISALYGDWMKPPRLNCNSFCLLTTKKKKKTYSRALPCRLFTNFGRFSWSRCRAGV